MSNNFNLYRLVYTKILIIFINLANFNQIITLDKNIRICYNSNCGKIVSICSLKDHLNYSEEMSLLIITTNNSKPNFFSGNPVNCLTPFVCLV